MSGRTQINQKARRKIAQICRDNDWTVCQVGLPGCLGEAHGPAHRHKRRWYYGQPDELLWSTSEWIPACQHCHTRMEADKELTERIFEELRLNGDIYGR